jgi:hypothetical protein
MYVYEWLPWLRFFRAFSSVVRQMPGWCPQRRGAALTLPNFFCCSMYFFCSVYFLFCSMYFLCCSMWCLFCDLSCIVCVYICTEQLPPGCYPIAVKYTSISISMSCSQIRILHKKTGYRNKKCLPMGLNLEITHNSLLVISLWKLNQIYSLYFCIILTSPLIYDWPYPRNTSHD